MLQSLWLTCHAEGAHVCAQAADGTVWHYLLPSQKNVFLLHCKRRTDLSLNRLVILLTCICHLYMLYCNLVLFLFTSPLCCAWTEQRSLKSSQFLLTVLKFLFLTMSSYLGFRELAHSFPLIISCNILTASKKVIELFSSSVSFKIELLFQVTTPGDKAFCF